MNPFYSIPNHKHACLIAQAFVSADDIDQMYACLRFVEVMARLHLDHVLNGPAFRNLLRPDGKFDARHFKLAKDLARAFRDDKCLKGIWHFIDLSH